MNCIIVDDDSAARLIVAKLCSKIPKLNILEEFSNAIEAIKFLNENEVDVIFLDIHMPGFSGLDFIKTLKDPPKVIFTTSDSKFAIEAFEYNFIQRSSVNIKHEKDILSIAWKIHKITIEIIYSFELEKFNTIKL